MDPWKPLATKVSLTLATSLALVVCCAPGVSAESPERRQQRDKRSLPLIFYKDVSGITLIYGFGVPVSDLDTETVVVGYVFRVSYKLPARVEDLKPYGVTSRQSRGNRTLGAAVDSPVHAGLLAKYRWLLYRGLAVFAERLGYHPGRACVLRSICEAAEVPFDPANGVLGELAHILLTPSSSLDELSAHSDNEYLHAEALGRAGAPCHQVFRQCPRSVLDYFSKVFRFSKGLVEMIG